MHRLRGLAGIERIDAGDVEHLGAVQFERGRGLAGRELQRDDAHADQVGPVDALEGLGDDRAHTQQAGALGRPVPRGTRAVLLAAEHHQRDVGCRIVLCGVVDEGLWAAGLGEVAGVATRDTALDNSIEQLVAQPDVGEGAADHHLVVAASRPQRVVVRRRHAVGLQVLRRRRALLDRAGRRDVIGRHRVTQQREHSGTGDVVDRRGFGRHTVEVRGLANVGRLRIPVEGVARRCGQAAPALVTGEHIGVAADEHLPVDRGGDGVVDFLLGGPDVMQENVVAVRVGAQRIGLEVEVHRPGDSVGDHQWWRCQVVHLHVGGDAALEVAVTGEHRRHRQIVVVDRRGDLRSQRTGVADAGGASVAAQVVAQLLQVRPQTGLLVVVGDHLRAGRHIGLDPRLGGQPLLDGFLRQ